VRFEESFGVSLGAPKMRQEKYECGPRTWVTPFADGARGGHALKETSPMNERLVRTGAS
jgi:hypothetical protein